MKTILTKSLLLFFLIASCAASEFLVYEGEAGVGQGKHIVFVANDHEYRSEQTCPLLAKILAKHHGFKCTVLFGLDEEGFIKAGSNHLPGLEALKDADLLVFYTRFMNLPDKQADLLVDYFERGGPAIGLRTSSHCFNNQAGKWARLNFNYSGEDYQGGLGKQVFGQTWAQDGQQHYGYNHVAGCRIVPSKENAAHLILSGVREIHAFSGAYSSPVPSGATSLLDLQVMKTFWASEKVDDSKPVVTAGWTRDSYRAPSGEEKDGRVVYASFGASEDLLDEDARRFLVNASFWAAGLEEEIEPDLNVSIVGDFEPSPYATGALYAAGVKPTDLAGWESEIMPEGASWAGLLNPSQSQNWRIHDALKVRPRFVEQLQETVSGFDPEVYQPRPVKKAK